MQILQTRNSFCVREINEKFAQVMVKAFAHLEVFRKKIMIPLARPQKAEASASGKRLGRAIPTRRR